MFTRTRLLLVAVLAALMPAISCNAPTPPQPSITQTTFASSLGIDLADMSIIVDSINKDTLYYQDVVVGTGEVIKPGTLITVQYTAYLPNGTEFDASSSHESVNTQFTTESGQAEGTVELAGWMDGIPGMRNGGTRLFIFPPGLAFGGSTYGGAIPSNSIVVYRLTVTGAG